jgi:hypothetical protein
MKPLSSRASRSGFAVALLLLAGVNTIRAAGPGLLAEYFDNSDFTTLRLTTTNATVNFDWGAGIPAAGVGADTFSVRWSGQVEARFSETYTFHVVADDGARLWVNDRLLLTRTVYSASAIEMSGTIALEAGRRYNLVLEYMENTGNARVQLGWSSASQPKEIIPQSQLYPAPALPEAGSLLKENWTGIAGTNLSALTNFASYPNKPNGREFLTSFECFQRDWTNDYGSRVSGFILPAVSGNYTFAVAGADTVQLFLSTTTNAVNRQLIASVTNGTGFRQFTNSPSQISAPIALSAGQKYFVELLLKAGVGDDHFSVAWQPPGATNFTVIPADSLVPAGLHRAPVAQANYFDTLVPTHPRLLVSNEKFEWMRRTVASNSIPQLRTWWVSLSNSANSILTQPTNVYVPDERGTILGISRSVLDRVQKLALAWQMAGNTNFAERAWLELDAASQFPDWHPAHFLDTAEMTHAFAIGYDWLYDYWTPARRTTIRSAIINKGLNQSLTIYTNLSSWASAGNNNWNLVCNGGMVLGALAIGAEHESTNEFIVARAITSAAGVLRHFTTDNGGWYEGAGYWDYTTEYAMRLFAGLESALGSDYSLSDIRGTWETGLVPMLMVGPTKLSFNFADAGAGNLRGFQMFWLARRYNRPEFAWYERTNAPPEVLDALWYDARGTDPAASKVSPDIFFRGPQNTTSFEPADALTLRTRWNDVDATFLGTKAGELGASHGNLDAGGFVLDALGRRWAHDLGGDSYALPGYFGAQRWDYYRLRAEGHNTLVVNPTANDDQVVGATPPVVLFQSAPEGDRSATVMDLTTAYTGVTRLWRGFSLFNDRRHVLVQDEIQASTPATVWWFMHVHTNENPVIEPDGTSAMLTQGTDRLWLKILSGGGTFALSNAVPLPTSPNDTNQNANASYRKFAIKLTNVTNTTLAVLMVPLNPGENPPASIPALTALSTWGAVSNQPPTLLATNVPVPGAFVDIDLGALVTDNETALADLLFTVTATNGTVTLLADGRTARFTPGSNFFDAVTFRFTVTDTRPDARLLLAYDFESPVSEITGNVTDASGQFRDGTLEALHTGTFAYDTNSPPALGVLSAQSLRLTGSGTNEARLSRSLPATEFNLSDNDWTFAGWFRRAATANDDFIFYVGDSDGFGGNQELHLYGQGGQQRLVLAHYNSGGTQDVNLVSATTATTGAWHHAAVVFDRTAPSNGTVRLYLDGSLVGSTTVAWALNQTPPLRFGGHNSTTFGQDRWFNGHLDDLALFRSALSATDIARLAQTPVGNLGGLTVTGLVTVTPPVKTSTLISTGAVWRFHDSTNDPGPTWRDAAFNDSLWKHGFAQLGFGDGDETSLVTSNGQVATYFRRAFTVADASKILSLTARLLRDDGAVVHLNGVEVWRSNMPTGVVAHTTPASSSVPAGDETTNFYTQALSPALLVSGLNLLAVEVHQNTATSSDLSFDFDLTATSYLSPPNLAPDVLFLAPTNGAALNEPANVTLSSIARDGDGMVARVEFFDGATKVGEATVPPYSVIASNLGTGPHTLTALVTDNNGATGSDVVTVEVVTLIPVTLSPAGSVWKYLDNGSDQGTAWRSNNFNDATWAGGRAMLGYGDASGTYPRTTNSYGPNPNNKYITTYYRRALFIPNAADISSLTARLQRDDGAVVYLNGAEVWRNNMPAGTITNLTLASSTVSGTNETNWVTATLNPAALFNGTNFIAVEIHQDATNSSDIAFDFELNASVAVHQPPPLTLLGAPGNLTFTWPADAAWFALRSATNLTPPVAWTTLTNTAVFTNATWRVTLPATTNGQRFFRLQTP